jgi:hypothetical protein
MNWTECELGCLRTAAVARGRRLNRTRPRWSRRSLARPGNPIHAQLPPTASGASERIGFIDAPLNGAPHTATIPIYPPIAIAAFGSDVPGRTPEVLCVPYVLDTNNADRLWQIANELTQ